VAPVRYIRSGGNDTRMTGNGDGGATVLVVEDEQKVRETYELWLSGEYEVLTAENGEEALDVVDDSVDVVLLDRLMPGLSGKETLAQMRERDFDCRYAMVTAVEPDFDIIEMGFDAYLNKPVTEEQLRRTLDELRSQDDYEDTLDEYTSLLAKRETLKTQKSREALDESEEFARLEEHLADLEAELDQQAVRTDDDAGFVATLRGIDESATHKEPEDADDATDAADDGGS